MRNGSYETSNVDQVVRKLPGARELLAEHRINTGRHLSLREACLAASVAPDEMLAQIEARARRLARSAEQPAEKQAAERELMHA